MAALTHSKVALGASILATTSEGSADTGSDRMLAAGPRNVATFGAGHDVLGLLDCLLELNRHIGERCSDGACRCRCRTRCQAQSCKGAELERQTVVKSAKDPFDRNLSAVVVVRRACGLDSMGVDLFTRRGSQPNDNCLGRKGGSKQRQ